MVSDLTIVTSAVAVTSAGVSTAAHLVSDPAHAANLERTPSPPAIAPRTNPRAPGARESLQSASLVSAASETSHVSKNARTIEEPVTKSVSSLPLPSSDWPLDSTISTPVAAALPDPMLTEVDDAAGAAEKPATPWSVATDGGVAIGRASRNAGVATAGFFSRFGKKIAKSF
jgi:hypothetical protein